MVCKRSKRKHPAYSERLSHTFRLDAAPHNGSYWSKTWLRNKLDKKFLTKLLDKVYNKGKHGLSTPHTFKTDQCSYSILLAARNCRVRPNGIETSWAIHVETEWCIQEPKSQPISLSEDEVHVLRVSESVVNHFIQKWGFTPMQIKSNKTVWCFDRNGNLRSPQPAPMSTTVPSLLPQAKAANKALLRIEASKASGRAPVLSYSLQAAKMSLYLWHLKKN